MYSSIDSQDLPTLTHLLSAHPSLLNAPLSSDMKIYPLTRAAWRGDHVLCDKLIEMGANVDQDIEKGGCTALMWAVRRSWIDVVTMLLARGAKV
ncbi:MAG: ankyrin repeat domain-containing protein, partial [bacterium]